MLNIKTLPMVAFGMMVFAATGSRVCAFTITPTFDASINGDSNAVAIKDVINSSIQTYQSLFTDPINVTINFKKVTSGLGQSSTSLYKLYYSSFIQALSADAKTADDITTLTLLPLSSYNPVTGSPYINLKTANIKALGFNFNPSGFDGTIGINTSLTDLGNTQITGKYSLAAVVQHEIDEVLGLGSDLGQTNSFFNDPASEDLFRYASNGSRSYTTNTSAKAYFSIDSVNLLAQFDNQKDGGDWADWQSNPLPVGVSPKVQDAFATPGSHPTLGVELRALDVIGYDFKSPSVSVVQATSSSVGSSNFSSVAQFPSTEPIPESSNVSTLLGLGAMGILATLLKKKQ